MSSPRAARSGERLILFLKRRQDWIFAYSSDRALNLTDTRVISILLAFMNSETEDAWPEQQTIADLIDVERNKVTTSIGKLERLGYLIVDRSGDSNRYSMAIPSTDADLSNRGPMRPCSGTLGETSNVSRKSAEPPSTGTLEVPVEVVRRSLAGDTNSYDQISSEGGACSAPPYTMPVDVTVMSEPKLRMAGAPTGARLDPQTYELVTEIFAPLTDNGLDLLVRLVDLVGEEELVTRMRSHHFRLARFEVDPVPLDRWVYRQGLMEASYAA